MTPSRVGPITPGKIPGHEKEPQPNAEDEWRTGRVKAGVGHARDVRPDARPATRFAVTRRAAQLLHAKLNAQKLLIVLLSLQ